LWQLVSGSTSTPETIDMSTIAITSLPVVTTGTVGDIFPIVQNGVTSQITNGDLFNSVDTINGLVLGVVGNTPNNIKIGDTNTAAAITTGQDNVAIGNSTLRDTTIGINNTGVGRGALILNVSGSAHTAVGALALALTTGAQNTGCGYNAGGSLTTGSKNVILGSYSGSGAPISQTGSNYVVLSDGDANVRAYWNGADATFGGLIGTSAAAATIASATTIAPTKSITFISGTAAVVTITAATSFAAAGGSITLIPTGAFTWTTAGNIAVAGTAVVSRALTMTYDSGTSKWYPSYV
jgi:hypothetical protein